MNIAYSLAQSGYWMSLCVSLSCAAVFLQARGYSNSRLGLVIGAGSLVAFLISPLLGGVVDRSPRLNTRRMLLLLLASQGLLIAAFWVFPGRSAPVSVCYCLYIAVNTCLVPLLNQLCFDMGEYGYSVNFGVARGIGSLAYAVLSAFLGALIQRRSPALLIPVGLALTLFQALVIGYFSLCCRRTPVVGVLRTGKEKNSSMLVFLRENRRFCCLMIGVAFLFFTHQIPNTYLINVVRSLGGDTADMGRISAFTAVMELPVMFCYDRISRRWGCPRCMQVSAVFFVLKALAIALARSIPMLYSAYIFQSFSYALVTPALVEYAERFVPHKDSARAQSFSYAMVTLGSIFSNLLGGWLMDSLGVSRVLLCGVAVSVMGMTVCLLSARGAKAVTAEGC